jgi:hypothetical protein
MAGLHRVGADRRARADLIRTVPDDELNKRRMVRRVLRKYGYPPDKQEKATLTVLEQAEAIAKDWAE